MALPIITDIAAVAKRRRKERCADESCYESLVDVDVSYLPKVPKVARQCWLVAKERIVAARKMIMAVPESLTHSQRKEVLNDAEGALMTGFNHLLTEEQASPQAPTLAPPTRSCYECRRQLVSNHKTRVSLLLHSLRRKVST
jgi:hypothetical protein